MSQNQPRQQRPDQAVPGRGHEMPQPPKSAPAGIAEGRRQPREQSREGVARDAQARGRGPAVPPQRRTEQETMESLLARMEETIHGAKKLPFSEQCVIDRDEMLFLIKMMREGLPEELRQAKWLLTQNRQLIAEARKEAENIMQQAEQQMTRMIDEHEITQQAQTEARRLLDEATAQSRQIHQHAVEYARDLLGELEEQLTEMLVYIQKNKKELDT